MAACFAARLPQEDIGRGAPDTQEFIAKTTQELQDARAMRRGRRSPGAAPHPGEDAGLRVCIDVPGLNRAASQERFWPSRVGRCKGPPHSYVRMPFGLTNVAVTFTSSCRAPWQLARPGARRSWGWGSQSHQDLLGTGHRTTPKEQLHQHAPSAASTSLPQLCQVTLSILFSWERTSGCIIPRSHGLVTAACILLHR